MKQSLRLQSKQKSNQLHDNFIWKIVVVVFDSLTIKQKSWMYTNFCEDLPGLLLKDLYGYKVVHATFQDMEFFTDNNQNAKETPFFAISSALKSMIGILIAGELLIDWFIDSLI